MKSGDTAVKRSVGLGGRQGIAAGSRAETTVARGAVREVAPIGAVNRHMHLLAAGAATARLVKPHRRTDGMAGLRRPADQCLSCCRSPAAKLDAAAGCRSGRTGRS